MSLTDKEMVEFEAYAKTKPHLYGNIEAEATKGQEPVAWIMETGYEQPFYMYSGTPPTRGKWVALYTTPQPCPACEEKQSAIDVWEGRYADLTAKCAELEHDCEYYRVNRDLSGHAYLDMLEQKNELVTKSLQQAERIKEIEADRDCWKSRYESNLSVNQMHSDNNAEMLKFNAKLIAERDALKKEYYEHDAELKRIIAGLRRELRAPTPAKRTNQMTPPSTVGKTNFEYWGIVETDEEFAERAGTQVAEVTE